MTRRTQSNQFIKELPYDVLSIGNHELYIYKCVAAGRALVHAVLTIPYSNTLDMYKNFAPTWNGRYLSSNVNITVEDPKNRGQWMSVPVGSRYTKFRTELGREVTAFGVLYDFTGKCVLFAPGVCSYAHRVRV